MMDNPRTDQEQWAADLLRLLGFNVKMNYWLKTKNGKREIDVLGRLGPLQVAVECKKLSKDIVGVGDINYFHEKLEFLGDVLGIFVANEYSTYDLEQCRKLGILPLTSMTVLQEISKLKEERVGKKHLTLSNRMWELIGALMRFADDWKKYSDPSWPFPKAINATKAFERHGLITSVCYDSGVFKYDLTESGEPFFYHLKNLLDIFTHEGVQPLENRGNAAKLLIEVCNERKNGNFSSGYERLIFQALGLYSLNGEMMPFGEKLVYILEDTVINGNSNDNLG